MIKKEIQNLISDAIGDLQRENIFLDFEVPEILVECPADLKNGDYSSNIAIKIAKLTDMNPKEAADEIFRKIKEAGAIIFEKIEIAGPGFLNFFVRPQYLQQQVAVILKQKNKFGQSDMNKGQKINVEFVSANPTGPLTLGNGRGGFCGDVLSSVLEKTGAKVVREYYINDRGEQVIKLGYSVIGGEQAVYKGKYIDELRKKIKGDDPVVVGKKAAAYILAKMLKPAIKRMGIKFDVWFSEEQKLYKTKFVDKAIDRLLKSGHTYQSEGAIWFKSQRLGDDKDRVLIRRDGVRTYFASDIAYLQNKINRKFDKMVIYLGADHYGYVARAKAAAEVLGFGKDNLEVIVMQLVRLMQDGQEVKMSKRAGTYVTLDELLDEVGLDAARFFFLMRSADTHLNFDLNLAKEQSQKNPVYYVQYAHARICSILRKAGLKLVASDLKLLTKPEEAALIKQLIRLPEIVEEIAKDCQTQRLPQYAVEVADAFHRFYEKCQVLCSDKKLCRCRLDLILATQIILKNVLDLMGISTPKKM